jgi:hypothetical protein
MNHIHKDPRKLNVQQGDIMNDRTILRGMQCGVVALMLTLAVGGAATAGNGAGAHGSGARGYSAHSGGRGPYGGGFRGGFHGNFGHYRGWGWDGLGFGLGYSLFFDSLPLYYSTLWWNNVPYYYADANYYQWNSAMSAYETVPPSHEVLNQSALSEATDTDLFAYPKNAQSTEQQAQDRSECRSWASQQTGLDPTQAGDTVVVATAAATTRRQDYLRAQAACLEARGYGVK